MKINEIVTISYSNFKVIKTLKRNRFKLKRIVSDADEPNEVYSNLFVVDNDVYEIIKKIKDEIIIKQCNDKKDMFEYVKEQHRKKTEEQYKMSLMSEEELKAYKNKKKQKAYESYAFMMTFLEKYSEPLRNINSILK